MERKFYFCLFLNKIFYLKLSMGWNNIEVSCGFGGGEETTRFGPRQETGSSLYQIDTVACVNNNDNV